MQKAGQHHTAEGRRSLSARGLSKWRPGGGFQTKLQPSEIQLSDKSQRAPVAHRADHGPPRHTMVGTALAAGLIRSRAASGNHTVRPKRVSTKSSRVVHVVQLIPQDSLPKQGQLANWGGL
jgi:hypothetical protein